MKKEQIITHITDWLTSYCDKAGMMGFVVGISGGIDSALTSTLCAKTGKKVICINMPILQHSAEYERAEEHIHWLKENFDNVSDLDIDLTDAFLQLKSRLPQNVQEDNLSMANTRARIRMMTLYAIGQANGLLVAGTGNKVEDFGIGFFYKIW